MERERERERKNKQGGKDGTRNQVEKESAWERGEGG